MAIKIIHYCENLVQRRYTAREHLNFKAVDEYDEQIRQVGHIIGLEIEFLNTLEFEQDDDLPECSQALDRKQELQSALKTLGTTLTEWLEMREARAKEKPSIIYAAATELKNILDQVAEGYGTDKQSTCLVTQASMSKYGSRIKELRKTLGLESHHYSYETIESMANNALGQPMTSREYHEEEYKAGVL